MLPFDVDHVPDKVQALMLSLATSPAVPGPVLLSMVSKGWASAAARSLRSEADYSISLALCCGTHSSRQQYEREEERLVSLAAWLQRYGHFLDNLQLQVHTSGAESDNIKLARGQAIRLVMHALATAGMRPGGLQLQQLQAPALGNTLLSTITQTLSGCHHLRALQLDYSDGTEDIRASKDVMEEMAAALQQLTQLTSLKLAGEVALHYPHNTTASLDGLLGACLAAW
jgi:hypothetical protein